jgi:hypothetical protein
LATNTFEIMPQDSPVSAEEQKSSDEIIRRDAELSAGIVKGRSNAEVMKAARDSLG